MPDDHGMLGAVRGLSEADLAAIADLERRVVRHDGGRLKLEWGSLRNRSGQRVDDLLWRGNGKILGFLGLYGFGSADLELAGMVDPAVRRGGIGTALLKAAGPIARERGFTRALLVTPRSTPAGRAFAAAHNAALEHSEHFLSLGATPTADSSDPRVTLRPAATTDIGAMSRILATGFGFAPPDLAIVQDHPAERTLVIERDGSVVGTLRLSGHGDTVGVYGFAVDPQCQGQGIGRDVLTRVCRQLRSEGANQVTLEVAVDNDRALDLYLSVGFERQATEDYYALPVT
jgi:ribosomal protein S18 acetylase RimI-like enzyme